MALNQSSLTPLILKAIGITDEVIMQATGLSQNEIAVLNPLICFDIKYATMQARL